MASEESAVLHNRAMITNNLSMPVKHKCMISAGLGGKDTLLTAIIAVNYKDGSLILDYGASDYLNKKLVSTSHVKFTTGFNGIQVAFTGEKITKVKYQGGDAFLMKIPSSLFWYNRREYYRVNTPMMNPSLCEIRLKAPQENSKPEYVDAYNAATNTIRNKLFLKLEEDAVAEKQAFVKAYAKMSIENKIKAKLERQKFEAERDANPPVLDESKTDLISLHLHDISLSGFSMRNHDEEFSFFLESGTIHENCSLIMPEHGEVNISFNVMLKRQIESHKVGEFSELVGIKLLKMKESSESLILRYIQNLERQSGVLNL